MIPTVFVVLIMITRGFAAPIEEPIRVDLPVYDQPEVVEIKQTLELENPPGVQYDNSKTVDIFSNKLQAVSNVLGSKLSSSNAQNNFGGIFGAPVTTLEGAILETEGLGSKTLSIKENVQNFVAGLFQPTPIVDTIKEEDKYGNSGEKFRGVGEAIVGGVSGVSNLVNSALEIPGNIFKKITRAATEKLNNLGGKLIGL